MHAALTQHESPILDEREGSVAEDGHWSLELVVPEAPKLHSEGLAVTARCYLTGPAPVESQYQPAGFTNTGPDGGEQPAPAPEGEDGDDAPSPEPMSELPATGAGPTAVGAFALLVIAAAARLVQTRSRRVRAGRWRH